MALIRVRWVGGPLQYPLKNMNEETTEHTENKTKKRKENKVKENKRVQRIGVCIAWRVY